jgi:hypothetical protein
VRFHYYILTALAAAGCAKAAQGTGDSGMGSGSGTDADLADASCGDHCDHDGDGVFDPMDMCPDTPTGQPVNHLGCADSQLTPTLQPTFPPFNLTWTPTGDLGRAGGLTWSYMGIERGDLFHIYWIVCDDPATPCGVSLDGPIDNAAEHWAFSAADSDLPMGKLVLTSTTNIALADTTTRPLSARVTLTITGAANAAIPFETVGALGVTARAGTHGAEIPATTFKVVALAEVKDSTSAWTPYLDYYDAAPTPTTGGQTSVSFGGSFYAK